MSSKEIRIDEDIIAFIVESREILEEVEPLIITLGQRLDQSIPADTETINHIFRAFHTIKGTAAFYQFDSVVGITHKAETLLELFRKGDGQINTSCTDLLCSTCDVIEQLFKQIELTGTDSGDEDIVKTAGDRLMGLTHLLSGRSEEFEENLDILDEEAGQVDDEGHEKINDPGKNGRLFLAEGRPYFEEVLLEAKRLSRLKESENRIEPDILNKCLKNLRIIGETADFLEFTNIEFNRLFGLVPDSFLHDLCIWQVVTYLFLHGSILHIFINLLI